MSQTVPAPRATKRIAVEQGGGQHGPRCGSPDLARPETSGMCDTRLEWRANCTAPRRPHSRHAGAAARQDARRHAGTPGRQIWRARTGDPDMSGRSRVRRLLAPCASPQGTSNDRFEATRNGSTGLRATGSPTRTGQKTPRSAIRGGAGQTTGSLLARTGYVIVVTTHCPDSPTSPSAEMVSVSTSAFGISVLKRTPVWAGASCPLLSLFFVPSFFVSS